MSTIFLRFADRSEAISVLSSRLDFDTEQDQDGKQVNSSGVYNGVRYYISFLVDAGVPMADASDYVNVLWPDGVTPPDFDAYIVTPDSPLNIFG